MTCATLAAMEVAWAVVSIVVPLLLGAVLSLVGLNPPEFRAARICLILSATVLAAMTIFWQVETDKPLIVRLIVGAGLWAIIGAGFPEGWRWIAKRQERIAIVSTPKDSLSATQQQSGSPVHLVARYEVGALPIAVPAHSRIYVFRLHPRLATPYLFQNINDSSKELVYPPKKPEIPEFIGRCSVWNYGEKTLLDVSLRYELIFRESDVLGPIVSSQQREILIPAIDPRTPFTFYVVNQSPLSVEVKPSSKAVVRVVGESRQREVELTESTSTIMDIVQVPPLSPSHVKWDGLP